MQTLTNEQKLGLIGLIGAVATLVAAFLGMDGRRYGVTEHYGTTGVLPADVEEALENYREFRVMDAAYVIVSAHETETERYGPAWCAKVSETDSWGNLVTNV